jgi:hypothetical protein
MADYFSKYKGRGGPAIDPGIIQMMGSIGGSYARGIEKFGDEVGDAIAERAERKRQENATKFLLDWGKPNGVEDGVALKKAQGERDQGVVSARTEQEAKSQALRDALAQTGERGDTGVADEIRYKIDTYQTEIGKIQGNLFRKDKAIELQKKRLADPDLKRREAAALSGRADTEHPDYSPFFIWDMSKVPEAGMTGVGINKIIQDMAKEREKVAKKLPPLQEKVILANKFWKMESRNPGSSKGMDAPAGSEEHQTAIQRLDVFRELKDRTEATNKLRQSGWRYGEDGESFKQHRARVGRTPHLAESRRDLADVDSLTHYPSTGEFYDQADAPEPIPSLVDALPQMLGDKPEVLARLLNYERPMQKSALVENAKNELNTANSILEDVLSKPKLRVGDFQRLETDTEKLSRLYDDKKKYPKDFGEKVLSYLQKTQGPQYKVVDINGAQYLLTNQGATLLGKDNAKVSPREKLQIDQAAARRRESKENRADYDTDLKRIKEAISEINQKEYDMAGEGLNAEDIRRRKELREELESIKEEFKSAQGELFRDIGGDISDPYTDAEILQIR